MPRKIIFTMLFLISACVNQKETSAISIVPKPSGIEYSKGKLEIPSHISISYNSNELDDLARLIAEILFHQ